MKTPTPADLIRIKQVQRQRLTELNRKDLWTDKDFEEVFCCHQEWQPEPQEWFVSYNAIRELAFDARTPDGKAKKLQQLIGQCDQSIKSGTPKDQ